MSTNAKEATFRRQMAALDAHKANWQARSQQDKAKLSAAAS